MLPRYGEGLGAGRTLILQSKVIHMSDVGPQTAVVDVRRGACAGSGQTQIRHIIEHIRARRVSGTMRHGALMLLFFVTRQSVVAHQPSSNHQQPCR